MLKGLKKTATPLTTALTALINKTQKSKFQPLNALFLSGWNAKRYKTPDTNPSTEATSSNPVNPTCIPAAKGATAAKVPHPRRDNANPTTDNIPKIKATQGAILTMNSRAPTGSAGTFTYKSSSGFTNFFVCASICHLLSFDDLIVNELRLKINTELTNQIRLLFGNFLIIPDFYNSVLTVKSRQNNNFSFSDFFNSLGKSLTKAFLDFLTRRLE
jgi:hypothetical protein